MKRLAINLDVEGVPDIFGDLLVVHLDEADLELLARVSAEGWVSPLSARDGKRLQQKAFVYDTGFEFHLVPNSEEFGGATLADGDTIANCLAVNNYCWVPDETYLPLAEEMIEAGLLVESVGKRLRFMFRNKKTGAWYMTKAITIEVVD